MSDCAKMAKILDGIEPAVVTSVEPGLLPTECCWSCHDDDEELGMEYALMAISVRGESLIVCCYWATRWDDLPADPNVPLIQDIGPENFLRLYPPATD